MTAGHVEQRRGTLAEAHRLGDFRSREPRELVLAGDVDTPVLLLLGRLAVNLEASPLAHDSLEISVPLPVGGAVLDPRADVVGRRGVEPLACALGQREAVPVLIEHADAGEVLAQQTCTGYLQLELLGDPPRRRRTLQQQREDPQPLSDTEDPSRRHPIQRIPGR